MLGVKCSVSDVIAEDCVTTDASERWKTKSGQRGRAPGRRAEMQGRGGGCWYLVFTAKLPHLLSAAVPVV